MSGGAAATFLSTAAAYLPDSHSILLFINWNGNLGTEDVTAGPELISFSYVQRLQS